MRYRRTDIDGGCYFFTVNLADCENTFLVDEIDKLKAGFSRSIPKTEHIRETRKKKGEAHPPTFT